MATYVQIFFRPTCGQDVDAVVSEIADLTGTELMSGPDIYGGRAYVGTIGGNVAVELFLDNDYLDDDSGMPFSEHPYRLEFRKINVPLEKAQEIMEKAYSNMKKTGRYSMFSTYDLQYVMQSDITNGKPS